MKKLVAHIVPALNIGGVEIAIHKSHKILNEEFDYRIFYVRKKGSIQCNQEPVWRLFYYLICGNWRPDVVITSLWWAHPFGWLTKLWGVSWVAFFHNSGYAHVLDKTLLRWAWRKADYHLADSAATCTEMNIIIKQLALVVPYVFPLDKPIASWDSREIDFLWCGRSSPVKRIDLLIKFLVLVESYFSGGRVIIAVAGEVPTDLADFAKTSRLNIEIKQNLHNTDVLSALSRAKFYLLFSDYEGMSMSTIEAVQSGCVAVIRRVGEIPSYLDESACVNIRDDSVEALKSVALSVLTISNNPHSAESIRVAALLSIRRLPHYSSSLLAALQTIIKQQ